VLVVLGLALPVVLWQFSAQSARQREAEQKRLDDARAEVQDLLARGQTAARSQDWSQAAVHMDRALEKVEAEPALEGLRPSVADARDPVQDRLTALRAYQRFAQDRDDALFHATLAAGEDWQTSRAMARARACSALQGIGFDLQGKQQLVLNSSYTGEEKTEIIAGCYALLLVLAETEAQRLPGERANEHRRRLPQALALLDRASTLGLRTRAVHLRRARYLALLDDTAGAAREDARAKALAQETDLDPQDHFLVGHELYSRGDLAGAGQEFRRALQLNPGHFWTHYFQGICCVTAGKPEVAIAHLTICQSQQPRLLWIYLLRGFALGQMKDYAEAEAAFGRALALKPSPAVLYVLYNNRGVMRVGQPGALARGIEDLEQAAALRPDHYQARASLAEAHGVAERHDEAARHMDRAITLAQKQVQGGIVSTSTLARLHHSRARLHLQRSNREAAVGDLAKAARLAGDNGPLRSRAEGDRGRVLHLQQRFDEALAAYDAARKADPARVDVLRWRGEVLLMQRRHGEAAAAFDDYLKKGGTPSAAVHRQRGLANAQLGRHAEAIEDYGRALAAGPKEAEKAPLHLYRGQEYLASKALQPALRDFQEAQRLDPQSADACLGCAHVLVKLEKPQQAVAELDRVLKEGPSDPRLWHGAARVYAQAAAQLKAAAGEKQGAARIWVRYQEHAIVLLEKALERLPPGERRAYWREKVLKDAALEALRPRLIAASGRFGELDK
jgi:tetratricopeptide (TPR) repeat protein